MPFRRLEAPSVLVGNGTVWATEYARNRERNPRHRFQWRGGSVKLILRQLKASNVSHCAFCDGRIGAQTEEIEHFRPVCVPEYYPLSYQWENLFPICSKCNKAKGSRFDEQLVKPDHEGYGFFDYFIFNIGTGELKPNPAATEDIQSCAEVTIRLYKLNREDLRRDRKEQYLQSVSLIGQGYEIDDFPYRFQLDDSI